MSHWVGRRLGRVVVVSETSEPQLARRRFECVCDCGHRFVRALRSLCERRARGDEGCERCSAFNRVRHVVTCPDAERVGKKPCGVCYDLPDRRGPICRGCGEPWQPDAPLERPPALRSSAGAWAQLWGAVE
jgi:hypothetical protein